MNLQRSFILFLLTVFPLLAAAVPVVNDDSRTVPQGVTITIDVLNNDFDDDGDSLSVSSVVEPANGTVIINEDGGITYTPDPGYTGADQFSYNVVDDSAAQETGTANVFVNVVAINYTEDVLTPNEASVALALNQICEQLADSNPANLPAGQDLLAERCQGYLEVVARDQQAGAEIVRQITPEETLALTRIGANASDTQGQIISNRLSQLGSGLIRAAQGGLSWSAGRKGAAAGDGELLSRWGVFASAQLEDAEKERTLAESGFDNQSNGIALGADYAFSSNWFAGGALGYTANELEFHNEDGTVESDIYTFIVFSTFNANNFSFDVQIGGGNSNLDISRYLAYDIPLDPGFATNTVGQTSGSQWFLSLQSQYMWSMNALTLFPLAKLNYSGTRVQGYADNNASGWEIVLDDQKVQKWVFETGLQATYAINMSWGVMVPNAELNIFSTINDSVDEVNGYFAYAPTDSLSFDLSAEEPDSLYYQVGLGSSFIFPGGNSGFIGLSQLLGYADYRSTTVQASLRMEF